MSTEYEHNRALEKAQTAKAPRRRKARSMSSLWLRLFLIAVISFAAWRLYHPKKPDAGNGRSSGFPTRDPNSSSGSAHVSPDDGQDRFRVVLPHR